ncbi:cation:H+ antiporter [Geothermobacter ehrlichii]|uniref:Cation:H+ antiporter n=1 Tax=Geothermobacter ehrlichii TaxID=213224 RepID=A0A5D3WK81_9BACT|nr:calcium/sodium antiporter [Geothermobacter ehrlichii]TYO98764.1 cation:H+ antiporter [Geothermobacter ehrlichii]
MLIPIVVFVAGLLLLFFGAESLVSGSSRLALSFGVRPLVIGMTVVAFATSMPEMIVSLVAAFRGSADLAAGNIVGSNIANIGLILGCAALLSPLAVGRGTLRRELPFLLGVSLLFVLLCFDGELGFFDGLVQLVLLLLFLGYCLRDTRRQWRLDEETQQRRELRARRGRDLLLVLLGIGGLAVGAEMMVRSAVTMARQFGISELVIGASVVAVGTSLPELAASVVSAWKGEMDISIGNVIGSNIFNLLFVLGICPMLAPLAIDPSLLRVQVPVMLVFTVGLWGLSLGGRIGRRKGVLLLICYALFITHLFRS